jgi:hypothetical protein
MRSMAGFCCTNLPIPTDTMAIKYVNLATIGVVKTILQNFITK